MVTAGFSVGCAMATDPFFVLLFIYFGLEEQKHVGHLYIGKRQKGRKITSSACYSVFTEKSKKRKMMDH